ncbi:MAG: hypothetical protein K6G57_02390 [Lachnospiraceae bacterium]|nr:hypothetical protein [Lachnospiraceae bacterium]
MRITLAIGEYAENPYRIPEFDARVSSLEELCYFIRQNASLLDRSFMSESLVEWIGKSLRLPELSRLLAPFLSKGDGLTGFIEMTLRYSGLYDNADIAAIVRIIGKGIGLGSAELKKRQADEMLENKEYAEAIRSYRILAAGLEAGRGGANSASIPDILADIYHNLGCAYARLMRFDMGSEAFEKAYKLSGSAVHRKAFLASKRLELGTSDYLAYTESHPEFYDISLQLERAIGHINADWDASDEAARLRERSAGRGSKGSDYYSENDSLLHALKENYRGFVSLRN